MKKLIFVLAASLLLATMPIACGISMPNSILNISNKTTYSNVDNFENMPTPVDEPPNWANGNFTGYWGLDIWGETHIPLGYMFGYYKHNTNLGYFYAAFESFWGENDTWFIQGYFLGPFMFGSLGENEYANESLFVGLGGYNETHYHWRIMGQTGPTFFMHGIYTKFE